MLLHELLCCILFVIWFEFSTRIVMLHSFCNLSPPFNSTMKNTCVLFCIETFTNGDAFYSAECYTAFTTFKNSNHITNDTAERAISLVQQFCGSLTEDERGLQWLLRAVESQRRTVGRIGILARHGMFA